MRQHIHKRGQFYIISATVIIMMVASLINTLRTANPDLFQPLIESAGFQAYNFQRAASDMARTAHKAYATSGNRAIPEQILANFTAESSLFAEKNGMSITWAYAIENMTKERASIRYNTTLKIGTTKMDDSFMITRIGRWRQRIIMAAPGQVAVRLNFSDNYVANCTLQLNVSLGGNQQPANITSEGYSNFTGWHSQLPLEVHAGPYNRTDVLLEPRIDFTEQFIALYGYPQMFDINSVRVVENNEVGEFLQEVQSQFIPTKEFYNQSNASGKVMWIMNGSTPAGATRYYSILFDMAENGLKPPPSYPTSLTITDNMGSCYIEVNNSKARYVFRSGGCDDDSRSGGLRNAWIVDGSGHDIIDANNTYGQYFNRSAESGPILTYAISEGTLARSISYSLAGFSVNITAYSALPYYKMDINTSLPQVSDFFPVTEHHGGSLCEYRNDSTRKWAEAYTPFWNGEGYGIVGLDVSVTELHNTNYSCSRIRHRVNTFQNWTIYTVFRTPKYTAEDLYLEKYQPLSITLKNPQPYSGYCTSADLTFQAAIGTYDITYPSTAGQTLTATGVPVAPTSISKEEDISETIIE